MPLLDRLRTALGSSTGPLVASAGADTEVIATRLGEPARSPEVTIHVIEDTHIFEGSDGKQIWCGGYAPVDQDGTFLAEADHRTSDPRAFFCHVAGVTYRPEALADKRFAQNSPLKLIPEPDNPDDSNAVGIWDGGGKVQLGYVPATLSDEVATTMRSGTMLVGQVLREYRLGSARGKRLGLHVIICPAGAVTYVVHDKDD